MIENKFLNFLIIFLFFGTWISIGSDPNTFLKLFVNNFNQNLDLENINFNQVINTLRSIFPLLSFLICLYIIFKFNLFYKHDKFIYVLLLIQLIQIVTTFFSNNTFLNIYENNIEHIGRYYWTICSLTTILIFMISKKIKNFNHNIFSYISFFFLILMVFYFSYINLYDFLTLNVKSSIYNLSIYRESAYFMGHEIPRITGLSRSIVFLYIIIFFLSFNSKNYFFILKYLLLVVLGSMIFFYQSKFAIIFLIIVNYFFYKNFDKRLKGVWILILLFIFQIILFYSFSNLRIITNLTDFNEDKISKETKINETDEASKVDQDEIKHLRLLTDHSREGIDLVTYIFFSGRIDLWKKSLEFIKERPILGYGSMSDRIILNQSINHLKKQTVSKNSDEKIRKIKVTGLMNPVSNAYLYSLLSGGIFSLIIFLYFIFLIRLKILNIFLISGQKLNYYQKISCLILLVIFLRCLVENSIMLFGVDFIIMMNCLFVKEKI